ncbi:MAG: hypothetical protein LUE17_15530 [Planctomycetaceae bacterium]|nr:hypothetical protein [Planctomycetaceae bacterium]
MKECIALPKTLRRRAPRPDDALIPAKAGRSKATGGGWTTSGLDMVVARFCRQVGVVFTPYQIRHSVISWLQQNPGMSSATVQAVAAHASVTTQDAYGKRHGLEAVPAFQALSDLMANHSQPAETAGDQGGDVSAD